MNTDDRRELITAATTVAIAGAYTYVVFRLTVMIGGDGPLMYTFAVAAVITALIVAPFLYGPIAEVLG